MQALQGWPNPFRSVASALTRGHLCVQVTAQAWDVEAQRNDLTSCTAGPGEATLSWSSLTVVSGASPPPRCRPPPGARCPGGCSPKLMWRDSF